MKNEKISQTDRIRAYNRLLEKQAGRAVRPYRADGYVNLLNRYGTSKDATEHYQFQVEPSIPDDVLTAFYEGNGLFSKIIDTPAEEAIKHGFSIDDLTDQKTIDFYSEALDELDWDETAMTAIKWARLFGGSIIVMLINDGRGIDEPLDWSAIESIDDLRIYDRSQITPDTAGMFSYTADDPFRTRGSRLGTPEYYMVHSQYGSFTVHESRCLVFTNGVLPENTTNSEYRMWGIPEYIRLHRAIRDAELAHRCAPKMLDRSIQAVYKMKGLAELLATAEGEDNVLKRLQTIDIARGMLSSITIDSEGEDYDFRQFQFGGVSEVIDSTCNFLSALTSIPQTILFGRSPAGMNSTGEGDMENYYNFVERIQKRTLRSNLRYLLSVLFQAGLATGEIDEMPKIKVKFNPLWSMSENEQADLDLKKAQIQQSKASTAQIYVNMQCVDPSEVRRGLADSDEFDIDNLLDEDVDTDNELFEDLAESEDTPDEGNSSEAAPAATKLPQDMTDEEIAQKAIEGSENVDSEAALATVTPEGENIGGVGVVVVSDGKILCGTRHNDFGYGLICGPGGHVEKGETPEQAAFRETEEEFGISPVELIPLGLGPKEPDTGLTPMIFLCTEFNGTPECVDLEMVNPQFRSLEEIEELSSLLFQPFKDGINLMLKSLDDSVDTDGGSGSGNHGHEGVPGERGGSLPTGKALNDKVSSSYKTGNYSDVGRTVRSILKEIPEGSKFTHNGSRYVKTADTEFTNEETQKKTSLNALVNSTDYFDPSKAPVFEDVTSSDVANEKIKDKELKPSETEVKTVIGSVKNSSDLQSLTDEDRLQMVSEIEAENPQYRLQHNGSLANEIAVQLDLNNPPTIMKHNEFEDYVERNNCVRIWRGVQDALDMDDELLVSASEIEKEFMHSSSKDASYGGGNFGSGYHFSTNEEYARGFGRSTDDMDGRTFVCALKPDAKVAKHTEAKKAADAMGIDVSSWALLNGYDATTSETGVYNIFNREALIMEKPDDSKNDSIETKFDSIGYFSENPIANHGHSAIIKSQKSSEHNEDFGVPGMKWGEHKKEEDEPSEKGVKKTKVTKFKTKNGKMKVTQEVKARLGGKGGAKILKGDITDVEVFAGKGGKKSFDLADKFSSTYGGKSEDWTHSKGNGKIQLQDGTEKNAEIHWFECEGIGQTKWKIKKFN